MSEKKESKLGGLLIKKMQESREYKSDVEVGMILVQRDGGAEFVVDKINEGEKVLLRSLKDNSTILKAKDDLLAQLKTSGSA